MSFEKALVHLLMVFEARCRAIYRRKVYFIKEKFSFESFYNFPSRSEECVCERKSEKEKGIIGDERNALLTESWAKSN